MKYEPSRRFILGAMTAAAATRVWGANDKINVAIVGLGGRGSSHLKIYSELPDVRVAWLCDVDQAALERAQATLLKNTGGKAKEFTDMRAALPNPASKPFQLQRPITGTRWQRSGPCRAAKMCMARNRLAITSTKESA